VERVGGQYPDIQGDMPPVEVLHQAGQRLVGQFSDELLGKAQDIDASSDVVPWRRRR
jgi:hypothetical protein